MEQQDVKDMDSAYQIAGGRGKFQWIVVISCCITNITYMSFAFCLPYFLLEPEMECKMVGGWRSCSKKDVCSGEVEDFKFLKPKTYNFITEFNMLCEDEESSLLGSSWFFASIFSCVFVNTFSDIIGRLPMLVVGNLGNIASIFLLLFAPSYIMAMIVSGLIGFCTVAINANTYNYVYDALESKYATFNGTLVSLSWGIGESIIVLVMWMGAEWREMLLVLVLISLLFLFLLYWLRESPRFYYSKMRLELALARLRYIARVNGKELDSRVRIKPPRVATDEKEITVKEMVSAMCCSPPMLLRVVYFSYCFATCTFVFYAFSLNLHKLTGSIYLNGLVAAVSNIISCAISGYLLGVIGKKVAVVSYFFISAAGVFGQAAFHSDPVLGTIFAYVTKFGTSAGDNALYVFVAELFPTSIKSGAFGIGIFFSRFMSILSTPLALLGNFWMFIILGILSITAGGISIFLPVSNDAVIVDIAAGSFTENETKLIPEE